jgi:S1-C subfamily serine protease
MEMTVLRAEGAPAPGSAPGEPKDPRRRWDSPRLRRRLLIAAALAWAVALTAVVLVRGGGGGGQATPAAKPSASPSASQAPLSVAEVYQTLLPSVVLIQATGGSSTVDGKPAATTATGTGVIVNADGTILTAFHVVDGARAIKVNYTDGTSSTAVVATSDAKQDIATLTPAGLPGTVVPAVLGGAAQVGDDVVAIGNPLGLTASTTSGVVSGLDRVLARDKEGDISGLIQFDAAVNPGSSGGPLLNNRGQVVGIVVALANPTKADTFIGIGFAVPIGAALGAGNGNGQAPPL